MVGTVADSLCGRGWMNMLDHVIQDLLSTRLGIGNRRVELIARKVAIRLFGASWILSWSWMDNLAATVVSVRHDG